MKYFLSFAICISLVCSMQAQTRSPKRGVSFDFQNEADLKALQFGTSWFYSWGGAPHNNIVNTYKKVYGYEFYPMIWAGDAWRFSAVSNYVSGHPGECEYLLAFNEPNFQNQANLTPQQAADKWPDLQAIADRANMKIVSPACNYSGWATYGTPKKWFDPFFNLIPLSDVDGLAIHSYMGGADATAGYVEEYYNYYKKPIWLTEVCLWDNFPDNSGAALQQRKGMIDLIDALEQNDHCAKYAWFMPRRNEKITPAYPYMDLLTNTTGSYNTTEKGVLTETGMVFTYMSSYDKNFYHDVNTCIEAEHYITKARGIYMEQTSDEAGILNVYDFASNRELAYNVNVPAAGNYTVRMRVLCGASVTVSISSPAGTVTQNIANTSNQWVNHEFQLNLNQGKQKITFKAIAGTLRWNWFVVTNNNSNPAPMENVGPPVEPPPPPPAGKNVALGKTVTFSTEFNHPTAGFLRASNITDGSTTSRWGSNEVNNQNTQEWVIIDLGQVYDIGQILILWEAAYARSFSIEISTDGTNWTEYYSTTNASGGETSVKKDVSAGYVRINCRVKGFSADNRYYGYSIYEVEVYDRSGSSIPKIGQAEISLIPNSVENELTIYSGGYPVAKSILSDLNGRKLLEVNNSNTVDMSACSGGIYLITITLSDGTSVVKKVIKN